MGIYKRYYDRILFFLEKTEYEIDSIVNPDDDQGQVRIHGDNIIYQLKWDKDFKLLSIKMATNPKWDKFGFTNDDVFDEDDIDGFDILKNLLIERTKIIDREQAIKKINSDLDKIEQDNIKQVKNQITTQRTLEEVKEDKPQDQIIKNDIIRNIQDDVNIIKKRGRPKGSGNKKGSIIKEKDAVKISHNNRININENKKIDKVKNFTKQEFNTINKSINKRSRGRPKGSKNKI